MKTIQTEIIIEAPASKVWEILIDFPNYKNWNPFIINIKGKPKVGTKLLNTILLNDKEQFFKPTVLTVKENKKFEWKGKVPLGVFTGQHYFEIEDLGDGKVKFIHGENFSGWLSGYILKQVGEDTRTGFLAMNSALKELVEQKNGL